MGTVVWLNPRPANTPASQGLSRTLSQLVIWTKILDFSSTDAGAAVALPIIEDSHSSLVQEQARTRPNTTKGVPLNPTEVGL